MKSATCDFRSVASAKLPYGVLKGYFVPEIILSFFVAIRVFFRSRSDTALEVLALRQQLAVLKRKRPRPKLNSWDRLFWTSLRQCWSRWPDVLVLVKPDTVVGWHRAGFGLSIGAGDPGHAAADRRLPRTFAL